MTKWAVGFLSDVFDESKLDVGIIWLPSACSIRIAREDNKSSWRKVKCFAGLAKAISRLA